jgi:hypothetical protein
VLSPTANIQMKFAKLVGDSTDKGEALDLADFVLKIDKTSGIALTEEGGYPII